MKQEARKVDPAEIRRGRRHRKDLGDIKGLSDSIRDLGLLHPIVVTPELELIAGERRLKACVELGWDRVPITVVDIEAIALGEFAENFHRKAFAPSEWVAIGEAVEAIERKKAKERQAASGGKGRIASGKLPEPIAGRVRDNVAKVAGTSGRTYEKAKAIVQAVKEEPEKFAPLKEEMDRTGRVSGAFRKLKIARQVDAIASEPPPLPKGPFRVIVADPPWQYTKRAEDQSHRAAVPYPSMTIDEIKALPVEPLATDDAILWLWTTNSHLEHSFAVARAWGFEQKTILTWVKDQMGMGDWLRGKTEHCLLCVRGKPTIKLTNQTTVLDAPRGKHSEKPEAFYLMVEEMCPGSKMEMFQRKPRPGWAGHGDESGPTLPRPQSTSSAT